MGKRSYPDEAHQTGKRGRLGVALSALYGAGLTVFLLWGLIRVRDGASWRDSAILFMVFGGLGLLTMGGLTIWGHASEIARGGARVLLPLWIALIVVGFVMLIAAWTGSLS
jgi:hypothetical protein